MENLWLSTLKAATKSAILQGNLKKVHYAFTDGREMLEEYNTDTNVLTRRAWKAQSELGADKGWDIEVGDPIPEDLKVKCDYIRLDPNQPFVSKRITKNSIEWRIRNLPYKQEIYSVLADSEGKCIVVRTSNRKYFKRISIPELERVGLPVVQDNLSFSHKFYTLIITYKKPQEYIDLEKAVWQEVKNVVPKHQGSPNDCPQS